MQTFKVEWWEERICRCEIEIKAKDQNEAEEIAMEVGLINEKNEVNRDWTEEEEKTYFEETKETIDLGHISTEIVI